MDQPAAAAMIRDSVNPKAMPISPPTIEISTASVRNCRMMSDCRAPMARRMPISRVRSSTVASMMFMMPMPPTSSEMPAMQIMTIEKIIWVCCRCLSRPAGTITVKSPASLWVAARMALTTFEVSIESAPVATFM